MIRIVIPFYSEFEAVKPGLRALRSSGIEFDVLPAQGACVHHNRNLGVNMGRSQKTHQDPIEGYSHFLFVDSDIGFTPAHVRLALGYKADVVTLHVPGGAATANLITADRIALMRPSAILLNASRGGVVDLEALNSALRSGKLGGAALDVYPVEPKSEKEEFITPLRGLENVILTPHIGGSTEEAQENIGREVADKLARYLLAGTTRSAVNFPEIAHQHKEVISRVLHVHRNEPGVIARMNALFAESGLNIVAQHLQTMGSIGYAVTDVDAPIDAALMKKLCGESATIRCHLV